MEQIRFGEAFNQNDPDKSDVKYKKYLKKYLLKHGYNGIRFTEVNITTNDVEAITEDGIKWYFEVKGTTQKDPLFQTYGNEVLMGIENSDTFRIVVIRYYDGNYMEPLFFEIQHWVGSFSAQLPSLKGKLFVGDLTQEKVDHDVIRKPKRRKSTLMGNEKYFIESKNIRRKYLEKQNDSQSNHLVWKFFEKEK